MMFLPAIPFAAAAAAVLAVRKLRRRSAEQTQTPNPPRAAPPVLRKDAGEVAFIEAFGEAASVCVVIVAPPNSGKSCLAANIASVLKGQVQSGYTIGASITGDQCTTHCTRRGMVKTYGSKRLKDSGKELVLVDTPGLSTDATYGKILLDATLMGKLQNGEALQLESLATVLARPFNPALMATVVLVPVRANALMDPFSPKHQEYLDAVRRILKNCEHVQPDKSQPGFAAEVIILVTCCDMVAGFDNLDPRSLTERSPAMDNLLSACERAEIPTRHTVFLGWLHQQFDYEDTEDPRHKALWTVLCHAADFGVVAQQTAKDLGLFA